MRVVIIAWLLVSLWDFCGAIMAFRAERPWVQWNKEAERRLGYRIHAATWVALLVPIAAVGSLQGPWQRLRRGWNTWRTHRAIQRGRRELARSLGVPLSAVELSWKFVDVADGQRCLVCHEPSEVLVSDVCAECRKGDRTT